MSVADVIALIGVSATVLGGVATAIWGVAKIGAHSRRLADAIERLTVSVDRLERHVFDHGQRIARLEGRTTRD
jgi:hypothetical protein